MSHRIVEAADHWLRLPLVTRALTTAADPSEIVEIVVRQGMAGLDAEGGVLALIGAEGVVVPVVTCGYPRTSVASFGQLRIDQELPLTTAAREGEPVWVSGRDDAGKRFPALIASPATVSDAWAAIPLTLAGRPFGVLGISFLGERAFTESERFFLCALADLGALALTCPHDRGRLDPTPTTTEHSGDHGLWANPNALGRLDNAINQAYAASLGVANLIESPIGAEATTRLQSVLEALDIAIAECRAAALTVIV